MLLDLAFILGGIAIVLLAFSAAVACLFRFRHVEPSPQADFWFQLGRLAGWVGLLTALVALLPFALVGFLDGSG